MTDFRPSIARALRSGPAWANSFRLLKTAVAKMVADGEAERVRPPDGRARNMIALTQKGRKKYEETPAHASGLQGPGEEN